MSVVFMRKRKCVDLFSVRKAPFITGVSKFLHEVVRGLWKSSGLTSDVLP